MHTVVRDARDGSAPHRSRIHFRAPDGTLLPTLRTPPRGERVLVPGLRETTSRSATRNTPTWTARFQGELPVGDVYVETEQGVSSTDRSAKRWTIKPGQRELSLALERAARLAEPGAG